MPKSHAENLSQTSNLLSRTETKRLKLKFCEFLEISWTPPERLQAEVEQFIFEFGEKLPDKKYEMQARLLTILARKLRINKQRVQAVWNALAKEKKNFDPATKAKVGEMFDKQSKAEFSQWLLENKLSLDFQELFQPANNEEILINFNQQLVDAKVNRSDARKGVQEERRENILSSLWGSWVYELVDMKKARSIAIGPRYKKLPSSYFDLLRKEFPTVLQRSCGGVFLRVPKIWWSKSNSKAIRDYCLGQIQKSYQNLSNHSYFSIYLEFPENNSLEGALWELVADLTIYAERFKSSELKHGFFHPEKIAQETLKDIPNLDLEKANFKVYQHGFIFKDCFINTREPIANEGDSSDIKDICLFFEKHHTDETKIPCPSCWSLKVRGNSYPIFGVRSWECHFALCPGRSLFNRGNRYSAMGILRSEALFDSRSKIPVEFLSNWRLDVVHAKSSADFLEMFVRHFSLPDDTVKCINIEGKESEMLGRNLSLENDTLPSEKECETFSGFLDSSFFKRYLYTESQTIAEEMNKISDSPSFLKLYCGSCQTILPKIPASSVDGAVTSPPYYNARDYSTWSNIYTYLYEMKLSAEGVFRVLKPGAYYLFNVFDYFDNENILSFSSMGKRRLPLGAYFTHIFRECGFLIEKNIVWHKGEIEGKRNYNHGKNVPFYQLPLNSWEHILVLRKPGDVSPKLHFPSSIYRRPVLKWIKGENTHGHTAPFPNSLPELICSQLDSGMTILDPYGGSLTTALVANRYDLKSIAIELHKEYCELGLRILSRTKEELF